MNKKQKTTLEQKPFDYNAKIMSLTKVKIVSINQHLNVVIKQMQKEIDMYKQKHSISILDYERLLNIHTDLLSKAIKISNELNESKKEQLFLMQETTKLITQKTQTIKSNTRFIKEIIFLNNRNIFQRIFNVQYNKHG